MQRFFISDLKKKVKVAAKPPISDVFVQFHSATGKMVAISTQSHEGRLWYEADEIVLKDQKLVLPGTHTNDVPGQSVLDLPVRTVSGEKLGKVKDVVVVWDTSSLHQLVVDGGLLASLFSGELLVAWQDIVEIRKDEIVVKNRLLKKPAEAMSEATETAFGPSPA